MKDIRIRLVSTVTAYDTKQFKKKCYNPYALGQYIERVDDIMLDIANGAEIRQAITNGFTGNLLNACLRAMKLEKANDWELSGAGRMSYQPVKKEEYPLGYMQGRGAS